VVERAVRHRPSKKPRRAGRRHYSGSENCELTRCRLLVINMAQSKHSGDHHFIAKRSHLDSPWPMPRALWSLGRCQGAFRRRLVAGSSRTPTFRYPICYISMKRLRTRNAQSDTSSILRRKCTSGAMLCHCTRLRRPGHSGSNHGREWPLLRLLTALPWQ